MTNFDLVSQSTWRVRVIDSVAKLFGVLVHVEGIPFGSNRNLPAQSNGETARAA